MNPKNMYVWLQAEEMAQTFRQRIAQAEAMARADMLRFQPEVCDIKPICILQRKDENTLDVKGKG